MRFRLPSSIEAGGIFIDDLNDDRWLLFDFKRPSTIVFAPKGRSVQCSLLCRDANLRGTIVLIESFRFSVPLIGQDVLFSFKYSR